MTDTFGPYRLLGRLASEGSGTLHRARDRFRNREVALRIFEPGAETPEWRRRTWDALRATPDPGWAAVHSHGKLAEQSYVDAEWFPDRTLADALAGGTLAPDATVVVLERIAATLDRAHALGAYHGGLVPCHVRLTIDGPVLTDFAVGVTAPDRDSDLAALEKLYTTCTGKAVVPAQRDSAAALLKAMRTQSAGPSGSASPPPSQLPTTQASWWVRSPAPNPASPFSPSAPASPTPKPWIPQQRGSHGPTPSAATQSTGTWWHRGPTGQHGIGNQSLTIGRDPACDVVINDLLVSLRHAELRREGGQWRIVNSSWNGTFVNGRRVTDAVIGPHDVIGIGHTLLVLVGDRLEEYQDSGDVRFRADQLVVTAKNRRLLDGVSFELEERCLLAVVGPSGAGKSTLLGALTGFRPADGGSVEYEGRDLYDGYDELRQRIGFVPQDDILHTQLTVRTALSYAAELRFPAEASTVERERRVDDVLGQLGLSGPVGNQRISTLSGGQRKRTSVALELLTRPSLLFLDEPTTGLDPGNAREVMRALRGLTDEGRTVIVVTHDERSLEVCDRLLVLARGGRLAYFGPPKEAMSYFGTADLADLFLLLDRDETTDFAGRFAASPEAARYAPAASAHPPAPRQAAAPAPPQSLPRQQPVGAQFRVLCRRYLAVIAADRFYALFLLALPLVLSGLVRILPNDFGLSVHAHQTAIANAATQHHTPTGGPEQLLLVLIVAGAFAGFTGAFRELVKERAIYRREAAVGLSRSAYLGSKLAVLGVVAVLQAMVIAELGLAGQQTADAPLLVTGSASVVLAVVVVTVVMTTLGLLISGLIHNENRGMPILVVILMLQLVLCGELFPLHHQAGLEQASWLVPARWAYAMAASTTGAIAPGDEPDPLYAHNTATYVFDLVVLAGLGVAFVAATSAVLRRGEPRRPTSRW